MERRVVLYMARLIFLHKACITVFPQSTNFATQQTLTWLFGIAVCAIRTTVSSNQKHILLTTLGSSLHRGNRAAGWFDDLIRDRMNMNMRSVVLFEGVKGWASAGKDYETFMDGFVPQTWMEPSAAQAFPPAFSEKSQ